ncbi:hypothetical protein CN271_20830 [Bacillus cereus]|uniref:hypothetical protein n=1 Tax=Bacillus cereus TaxID=1396 RepID=UPI000BEB58DB|nr:hypothetical protein [Bacillus cereus]PEE33749.1 hypothetical protein CON59_23825 [Bacillus cereus]PET44582.1 hypothetical protein CN523_18585 [Bacillus cereus]PFA59150.1 hypothetical protein CN389_04545 [Bacillus cereus]PFD67603.1 hypothetical protein CN271_20830 [Bacillus cereus]PFE69982.1 hypothetical protein CN319_22165 [Bacillus cereus]
MSINLGNFKNREVVVFEDAQGSKLYVSPKSKSVEFLADTDHSGKFLFDEEESTNLINYLMDLGKRVKPDFAPKYGNSAGSDMYEYYDRKYDNNGYCNATRRLDTVVISFDKPYGSEERLYLMTMPKLADLLWAIKKVE